MAIPSLSGEEEAIAAHLAAWLARHGVAVERLGATLLALAGEGPLLLFDSHLDTVPPAAGWTRPPFAATAEGGSVYGLGSSDAKASVAAMAAAFVALRADPPALRLGLALVEAEETRGTGTEKVVAALASRGETIAAAVVGEPTGLDIAVAQKGLMVVELVARGTACHAAHAGALGAGNAALRLAHDLVRLAGLDLGPPHPELGATSLQPTVLRAGEARNAVPGEARAILDLRTVPTVPHEELARRLAAAAASEVRVLSARLQPRATDPAAPVVRAALAARPGARLVASPTLSDWALLPAGVPAIKCGPGDSRRSHTADERVDEDEILAAARFYADLARAFAAARAA